MCWCGGAGLGAGLGGDVEIVAEDRKGVTDTR